jgi:hypothetical protein
MLLFLTSAKMVLEIALLSLLGQGLLYVLSGERRQQNFFYRLFQVLTRPFTAAARRLTPALVADKHVPFVAFFLLSIGWVVVTVEKIRLCVSADMVGCR